MTRCIRLHLAVLGCCCAGAAMAAAETAFEFRDIAFTATCDGSEQRYVLGTPPKFDAGIPHDLLIALHGHGADRWQFVCDERDECRATRDAAREHDMIFLTPDYRATTSWMGPKAEADLFQIIQNIKRQYSIARVFLCGGSMGASAALTFTALHPDLIDGVAAMNGTANHFEYNGFQEAIRESFGGTKSEIPLEYKNRSAEFWPERFFMPVAITSGGNDDVVPPQSVLRLAGILRAMGRPPLLIHRPDAGHATNYEDGKAILEYIIASARSAPPSEEQP